MASQTYSARADVWLRWTKQIQGMAASKSGATVLTITLDDADFSAVAATGLNGDSGKKYIH